MGDEGKWGFARLQETKGMTRRDALTNSTREKGGKEDGFDCSRGRVERPFERIARRVGIKFFLTHRNRNTPVAKVVAPVAIGKGLNVLARMKVSTAS